MLSAVPCEVSEAYIASSSTFIPSALNAACSIKADFVSFADNIIGIPSALSSFTLATMPASFVSWFVYMFIPTTLSVGSTT